MGQRSGRAAGHGHTRARVPAAIAATLAILASALAVAVGFGGPVAAAGPIAAPNLISLIPFDQMRISHPSPGAREFDYTHSVYNAGPGPLDIVPTYDPVAGTATGQQRLYSYDAGGHLVLEQTSPIHDLFTFHAIHNHFHFPLASFGLYAVKADGSLGAPVALSPKNGFCIGDSTRFDPTLPHSPANIIYSGSTCVDPTAVRGIDVGWGDVYDRNDPGQAIDITGVPDGVYWFHSVVDPDDNFVESSKADNTTDIKIQIQGDTISEVSPLVSQGAFIFDQSFVQTGTGALSTPAFAVPSAGELLVALVSANSSGAGGTQTATVSGGGLPWTLAKRTNTQTGTADVWTAVAPAPASNVVVTSTLGPGGRNQALSVYAIRGASGIGAVAGSSGFGGAPALSLTTTAPGSLVLGVGNDPDRWLPRTPAAGQVLLEQDMDEAKSDTTWAQAVPAPVVNAGTPVTLSDAYPAGDRWNYTAVELLAAPVDDHTPPVISAPAVTGIGPAGATIGFKTDEPATTRIDYGPTTAYGQSTAVDPTLVVDHLQPITGLSPDTTYYCRLVAADSGGNTATLEGVTFTTAPPRTTPPVFSDLRVTDVQPDQVTVSWTTDEPADTRFEVGTTVAYGRASGRDPSLVTTHFATVNGLSPLTTYHYRADGTDAFGNSGTSADALFTTPGIPPPIAVDRAVFKDGRGAVTTASFSTSAPNELLVAFVAADGPASNVQTATVSGTGLTWQLMGRANTSLGTSEVWQALAPTALTSAKVTSNLGSGAFDQSLTVVAFRGAVTIGAVSAASGTTGAPSATLTTNRAGSSIYAVGNDWDRAVARTLPSGQSIVHQWVDSGTGDTFWTQSLDNPAATVQTVVTMADTAPTNDQWNLLAVELARPISTPASPPAVSGTTASGITDTTATITWSTDQPATTQVLYGTTPAYGLTTAYDSTLLTAHTAPLTGLAPSTTYHVQALSANGVGTTPSPDVVFTTAPAVGQRLDQTITFPPPADRTLAQSPVTMTATASSGLTVTFSTTTPGVCTAGGANGATITLVAAGQCTVQADQAGDATYNPAPSVRRSFQVTPPATGPPVVDKTVAVHGTGSVTTAGFSTATPDDLVVAFVAADGAPGGGQTASVSAPGLTWTLVRRSNAQLGTAEIWVARASGLLRKAKVQATVAQAGYDLSLTVVAIRAASGLGASATASASSGAPTIMVTTTRASSLVFAVGNDWDRAVAHKLPAGQVMVSSWVDQLAGDTFWVQTLSGPAGTAGQVVTLNDTSPTTDRWNLAAVEIVP